jgi:hypothetical protein
LEISTTANRTSLLRILADRSERIAKGIAIGNALILERADNLTVVDDEHLLVADGQMNGDRRLRPSTKFDQGKMRAVTRGDSSNFHNRTSVDVTLHANTSVFACCPKTRDLSVDVLGENLFGIGAVGVDQILPINLELLRGFFSHPSVS